MYLKKIAAGAAMVGALGFSAVGLGAGIASATPSAPAVTGILWQQDRGHGGDWGPRRRPILGRPWRLGLRWKLGLRARVGLRHRPVWACHLVPLVAGLWILGRHNWPPSVEMRTVAGPSNAVQ
jgi:hypothetical protein